jgi:hypothetical protein
MTAAINRPELIVQLTEGISNVTSTGEWRRYLEVQSRFHNYSYRNVILIAAQCEGATRIAGFNTWRKLNRAVRKGEKAIWILAPMLYRKPEDPDSDRVTRGFKFVAVFDVAQTEGEELPSICQRLNDDTPTGRYLELVKVAHSIGFRVEDHRFVGETNGDCCHSEHRIRIETANTAAQRVKTLAHELSHALLHESYDNRRLAELEAESTAYVVCRSLGIDSSGYSFGYLATWAGGGDKAIAGIKSSCERIQKTASTILGALEHTVVDGTEKGHSPVSTDLCGNDMMSLTTGSLAQDASVLARAGGG